MAVFACGGILGGGLTTAIGGVIADYATHGRDLALPLVGTRMAWQVAFIVIALPGVPLAFLAFFLPDPARVSVRARDDVAGKATLIAYVSKHRGFYLRHFFAFGLVMMLGYAILGWTPIAMTRDFGWSMAVAGPWLGLILIVSGLASLVASGRLVDGLAGRGMADAHLRYYAFASIVLAVAGSMISLVDDAAQMLVLYTVVCLIIPCIGISNTALQIATPVHLRGQVSALLILVGGIVGAGMGTTIVGAATDYLFCDPARVRDSMALVSAIFGPIAALLFYGGLRPFVRAIADARHG
jgi:MFS family permease